MTNVLRIHPQDNVAVALRGLVPGDALQMAGEQDCLSVVMAQAVIPFGHKVALTFIPQGASIIKYGEPIGVTTEEIHAGEHVHVHNLRSVRGAAKQ